MAELVARESWFPEVFDHIAEPVSQIEGARVLYLRAPEGEWYSPFMDHPGVDDWDEGDEAAEWEDTWEEEPARSYGLVFLSPEEEGFRFEIVGEVVDQTGRPHTIPGEGHIGFAVAISTIAPFAVIRLTSLQRDEGFGLAEPDIHPRYFDEDGLLGSTVRGMVSPPLAGPRRDVRPGKN